MSEDKLNSLLYNYLKSFTNTVCITSLNIHLLVKKAMKL